MNKLNFYNLKKCSWNLKYNLLIFSSLFTYIFGFISMNQGIYINRLVSLMFAKQIWRSKFGKEWVIFINNGELFILEIYRIGEEVMHSILETYLEFFGLMEREQFLISGFLIFLSLINSHIIHNIAIKMKGYLDYYFWAAERIRCKNIFLI